MPELTTVQQIAIWILPVLFAITFHEAAHAWTAYRLGDPTAKSLGRLSFNPMRHVDLVGTVLVPLIILVLSQFSFVFGWAKPVPINSSQFKNPRRDLALATAAGPLANFIMAFLWGFCLKISSFLDPKTSTIALFLLLTARAGILINLLLAFLNLLPIPPLDGSRVVAGFLPPNYAAIYYRIEPFGFLILLVLVFTGILSWLLSPLIMGSIQLLLAIFNL